MRYSHAGFLLLPATLLACAPDAPRPAADLLAPAFAAGGGANSPCEAFRAEGETFAVNQFTFEGNATLWIGDRAPMAAAVTTYLTGAVKQGNPAQGAQVVTTAHVFDLGSGNVFVTEDIARLVPTSTPGLYRLLSTMRIVPEIGTPGGIVQTAGTFAGVPQNPNPAMTGDRNSTMNLGAAPPVARWSVAAHICGYAD
jgi:hypothetical protein